ncbi:hypothetical protein V6259_08395 [Marinomonas sp. TI.3.20]|uniref:hypothetical protein n=1 Tax=Marinomonas sp. TI.3.20 TaxID=3121296 RepID=UPI00311FCCBF
MEAEINNDLSAMIKLKENFKDLAEGNIQIPKGKLNSRIKNCIDDKVLSLYQDLLINDSGPLFKHFLASIPNILEELSRISISLKKLNESDDFLCSYWEIEAFDGTNGRALNKILKTEINILTNSPNFSNKKYFINYNSSGKNYFEFGTFFEIYDLMFQKKQFFDFIYEMAAFQFYGRDRYEHVSLVKKRLAKRGIAIFLEKLMNSDENEFILQEDTKDWIYKKRFFSEEEIIWKRKFMLEDMHKGLLTKNEFEITLCSLFENVALIWNSTNFYEYLATNDTEKFDRFLCEIGDPYIETVFQFYMPVLIKRGANVYK